MKVKDSDNPPEVINSLQVGDVVLSSSHSTIDQLKKTALELLKNKDVKTYLSVIKLQELKREIGYSG